MNRANLDQLRAFLNVVRLGGISKAATALSLTQPAVTARIRNLEAFIGAELFLRTGSGMKLTKRGELLLNYAERFEQLSGLMQRDVVDPAGVEGRLRLGVSETIAQSWLPDLIFRLHERFPRLEIEFNVDISINLRDLLLERQIDLAVLLGPISEYSVENIDLPGFDLEWYRSARAEDCADASEYLRRPVLTYARHTRPYRELKLALFERVGPTASIFPSSSLSACFRLVAADLGVAALPIALARDFVREGSIRRFDPGWTPNPLHFTASFLAEPYSPTIQAAAALAREAADDHNINFSDERWQKV